MLHEEKRVLKRLNGLTSQTDGRKVKVLVAQSCLTLSDPMDCSLPGSSVHGTFQARVLEGVAIAFSGFKERDL